jgi:hypothetical protein
MPNRTRRILLVSGKGGIVGARRHLDVLVLRSNRVELFFEDDVVLRHVTVHQRYLRLVCRVPDNLLDDLPHWRYACSAGHLQKGRQPWRYACSAHHL